MSDGADLGINASKGARAAMGGPEPEESDERDPEQTRLYLLGAAGPPFPDDDAGYDEVARWVGRVVYELFVAHPELVALPMDTEYDWAGDPDHGVEGMKPEHVITLGLNDVLLRDYPNERAKIVGIGLSGFQFGFGVNLARYAYGAGTQQNPALVVIDTDG